MKTRGTEIKNGKLIFTPDRIPKKTDAELEAEQIETNKEITQRSKNKIVHKIKGDRQLWD